MTWDQNYQYIEGGVPERECWIDWMDGTDEIRFLMAWTRDLAVTNDRD